MISLNYIHDMEKRYLVISRDVKDKLGYEQKMVMNNTIRGLLKSSIRKIDQEEQYYFDITGKKSLEEYFEQRGITSDSIMNIYNSIMQILAETKVYLLSQDNFILQTKAIFFSDDSKEISLCYKEDYHFNIQEQLVELTQYFMNHIDYQDEKAVLFVYGIYKVLREETCTFSDIQSIFEKYKDQPSFEPRAVLTSCVNDSFVEQPIQKQKKFVKKNNKTIWKENIERFIISSWCMISCFDIIILLFLYKAGFLNNQKTGKIEWMRFLVFLGVLIIVDMILMEWYKKKNKDDIVYIPDQDFQSEETMLLYNPLIHYHLIPEGMYSGIEFGRKDFPILIGNDKEIVGKGYIKEPFISKKHACLCEQKGEVKIKDRGSTNGTFVNGERLEENRWYLLKQGDEVKFSNLVYTFQVDKGEK